MKLVFLIIVGFLTIFQIHGQIKSISDRPLLKESITYCLNDTVDFVSKEIFQYNSDHQKIKKERIIRKGGSFERYKYYYNDLGKITSEDYYRNNYGDYGDSLIFLYTTKYLYDSENKLVAIGKLKIIDKEESWETVGKDSCSKSSKNYTIKKDGNNELFYHKNGQLFKKIEYEDSAIAIESYYRVNKLNKRILYSYKEKKLTKKYTEYYEILDPYRKKSLSRLYKQQIKRAESTGDRKTFKKLTAKHKELLKSDDSFKIGNFESEEYFYKNGLLVKEIKIDNGSDPCFYPCCGKYLIKHKYVD